MRGGVIQLPVQLQDRPKLGTEDAGGVPEALVNPFG